MKRARCDSIGCLLSSHLAWIVGRFRWASLSGAPVQLGGLARRAGGDSAVLKLSFPDDRGFEAEAGALRFFEGRGAAGLLELDLELGTRSLLRRRAGPVVRPATPSPIGLVRRALEGATYSDLQKN